MQKYKQIRSRYDTNTISNLTCPKTKSSNLRVIYEAHTKRNFAIIFVWIFSGWEMFGRIFIETCEFGNLLSNFVPNSQVIAERRCPEILRISRGVSQVSTFQDIVCELIKFRSRYLSKYTLEMKKKNCRRIFRNIFVFRNVLKSQMVHRHTIFPL